MRGFDWRVPLLTVIGLAVFTGLRAWAHWNALRALLMAFTVEVAILLGAWIWPRTPASLRPEVAKLEAGGFRRRRWHSLLCPEMRPHVHMVSAEGSPITLTRTTP